MMSCCPYASVKTIVKLCCISTTCFPPSFCSVKTSYFYVKAKETILSTSPYHQMFSQLLTKGCAWLYWWNAADLVGFQGFPRKVFLSLSPKSISCSKFGNLQHICERQYSDRFQVTLNRENIKPAHSWRHLNTGKVVSLRRSGLSF